MPSFHNPVDDDTREELIEIILNFGTATLAELEDLETWQLQKEVKDWREEEAAQDFSASQYSY